MNLIIGEKTEENISRIAMSLLETESEPFMYEGIKFFPIGKSSDTFFALGVKNGSLYKFICSCEWNGESFTWEKRVFPLLGSNVGYIGN